MKAIVIIMLCCTAVCTLSLANASTTANEQYKIAYSRYMDRCRELLNLSNKAAFYQSAGSVLIANSINQKCLNFGRNEVIRFRYEQDTREGLKFMKEMTEETAFLTAESYKSDAPEEQKNSLKKLDEAFVSLYRALYFRS